VVTTYLERREPGESFQAFVRRLPAADLDTAFARAARQRANDG
jgi:hypothetical protein